VPISSSNELTVQISKGAAACMSEHQSQAHSTPAVLSDYGSRIRSGLIVLDKTLKESFDFSLGLAEYRPSMSGMISCSTGSTTGVAMARMEYHQYESVHGNQPIWHSASSSLFYSIFTSIMMYFRCVSAMQQEHGMKNRARLLNQSTMI
jgi:hypothetical protein